MTGVELSHLWVNGRWSKAWWPEAYGVGIVEVNVVWVERFHWNIWCRCVCVRGWIEVDEGLTKVESHD